MTKKTQEQLAKAKEKRCMKLISINDERRKSGQMPFKSYAEYLRNKPKKALTPAQKAALSKGQAKLAQRRNPVIQAPIEVAPIIEAPVMSKKAAAAAKARAARSAKAAEKKKTTVEVVPVVETPVVETPVVEATINKPPIKKKGKAKKKKIMSEKQLASLAKARAARVNKSNDFYQGLTPKQISKIKDYLKINKMKLMTPQEEKNTIDAMNRYNPSEKKDKIDPEAGSKKNINKFITVKGALENIKQAKKEKRLEEFYNKFPAFKTELEKSQARIEKNYDQRINNFNAKNLEDKEADQIFKNILSRKYTTNNPHGATITQDLKVLDDLMKKNRATINTIPVPGNTQMI